MLENIGELSYQIDFITAQMLKDKTLVDLIESSSTYTEVLKGTKITRCWFDNFEKAFSVIVERSDKENINYRLICLATNSLFIQFGYFE